jgi:hypothetical protein
MKLSVEIPEERAAKLQDTAKRLGVGVEQLAVAAIADLTSRQSADFEAAAARILQKNREL